MIELKNVNKQIDGNFILNNISIKFIPGKIYGLVGRNGSGKSMLLRIMCGLIQPTTGEVVINGKQLKNDINIGNMGVLIEKPKFLEYLTGYENLEFIASIRDIVKKADIEHILKEVNLYEEKDKKYGKYSLGTKQKLAIACALMENPDIIILDEPFNGLDKKTTEHIRKIILEKKKQNKTIILATHIEADVKILCDELYEMDAGKIEKIDKIN